MSVHDFFGKRQWTVNPFAEDEDTLPHFGVGSFDKVRGRFDRGHVRGSPQAVGGPRTMAVAVEQILIRVTKVPAIGDGL
jgi:hypothetical protein